MLSVQNVSKQYGRFSALANINIEFDKGVYGLLSPNGAGKTTLIKMLVTLLFPSEGKIQYNGVEITDLDEKYRDVLGYLPQEFGYYKNYSPEQYLLYLAVLKGMNKQSAKARIAELLRLVHLEEVSRKRMKKFSGGMIQRVGIAQAMLNDPEILILDEPTAGLDPKERARFRRLLTELARDRIVILSTHIVSDVESIANEIILLKDKHVLYKDTPETISGLLDGKLYETDIAFEDIESYRERYNITAEKSENEKLKIRFVADEEPGAGWQRVTPMLEDVFLYIYDDEGAAV